MQEQRQWQVIMQPELNSLKFRLPWPGNGMASQSNQVEYLDGDIHLPVWGPHNNTTESRLSSSRVRTKARECMTVLQTKRRCATSIASRARPCTNGRSGAMMDLSLCCLKTIIRSGA